MGSECSQANVFIPRRNERRISVTHDRVLSSSLSSCVSTVEEQHTAVIVIWNTTYGISLCVGIVSIRDKHALREPLIRPTIAFLRYVANPIKDSLYPFRSWIIARLIYIYIYIHGSLYFYVRSDTNRIQTTVNKLKETNFSNELSERCLPLRLNY